MEFKRRKRKSSGKKPNYSFRAFLIALLAFFGVTIGNKLLPEENFNLSDTFRVHILDVGQGLSVLIESGEDTLLYDGGSPDTSSFVVSYLQEQGIETIDYCIASHYDADHLSGIVGVLHKFEIGTLIAPDYTYHTKTYHSFLSAAEQKELSIHHPTPGESFPLGEGNLEILAPQSTGYEDENDYSIVVKITIGESSLLLTGDATSVSESEMLDSDTDLEANVLVLGHHGSYDGTGADFFREVSPEYAIVSCGQNNDYGHPHTRIMNLLEDNRTHLYRTDLQGTVCFTMTAKEIVFDQSPCTDYATGDEVRYREYHKK